ncbi:MAG: GAF domain-containing sensor histidine kinase [Acidimicrobiia bacterium]|nr:GAF domain-containing sensor histidine kinase [Acidimicrobiia bacterium]
MSSGGFTPERVADLVEGAANVAAEVDLTGLLQSTIEIAMEITGARYGALGVLGDHGGLVDFVHAGMDPDAVRAIGHLPRGTGVLGTITKLAKTIRIDDIADHPDSAGFPDGHPEMTTFLGVPVTVGDRVFGNLYLTEKDGGFTEDDEILVEFLAVTAGSAINTLRMQERLRRALVVEDRERIARDLHDSIIQDLFAVGLGLQTSMARITEEPDAVRARLDDAVEKIDETIASLRRYIFDLSPPVWARPSLPRQLADLVGRLSAPYEVPIHLDVACDEGLVPPDLAEDLLQIVKEALSNALRHAGASEVTVRVGCGQTQVVVSVADDGAGFDPEAASGTGLGLTNMADRVHALGGSFRVETPAAGGTTVRASFPLGDDDA